MKLKIFYLSFHTNHDLENVIKFKYFKKCPIDVEKHVNENPTNTPTPNSFDESEEIAKKRLEKRSTQNSKKIIIILSLK